MKVLTWIVVLIAVAAGVWYFALRGSSDAAVAAARFRTTKIERGEVVEGVQASGTVQPILLVQVGTQVSGVIEKLFADFNSKVKEGQIIAQLDTRRLQAQVTQDEASIARATADLARLQAVLLQSRSEIDRVSAAGDQARADVDRVRALLTQAQRELERQKELAERHLVAASDLDAAVATQTSLEAQLASSIAAVKLNEAQLASARAAVQQNEAQIEVGKSAIKQSEAQLQGDRVNLDYARIVSPIDGVVVSRNVDVGQTVASSLQAPTLFVIANDLTKIQVQTSVPEADIGKLEDGQKVRFTVDAHPDRTFDGVVTQVRLASTTVQNVVTYTVLVDASNPDGLLLPGMTANVTFEIRRSESDVLHVASSALRVTPAAELLEFPLPVENADGERATEASRKAEGASDEAGKRAARGERGSKDRAGGARSRKTRSYLYVVTPNKRLRAIPVRVGISDGILTVVEPLPTSDGAPALTEGLEVVTAILQDDQPAATNPFAPPAMGGGRGTRGVR